MATRPVRVLVVDDEPLVRQLMSELLGADPGIEVVGTASDPYGSICSVGTNSTTSISRLRSAGSDFRSASVITTVRSPSS